ncbi:nucleotidyl transferase AbiEii/AbiGii toxin family protein [Paraburkholderia sp. BCC1886]|uniref:nucleotidyl transferase AbiEii/AbiGii toxin family protein n=1 Tax=Paraburkholderia sp. BCC1886 TaxID=2562670 RepID=UPI00164356E9|nr:nucleotidyl transferase AbiEii/AbiGii toxin family protein [Paraburkholderia sp. BCC1886]
MHHPLLRGFVLIGGTALTLRIGHRVSEDLDFAFVKAKLPRTRIKLMASELPRSGVSLEPVRSPVAEEEFLDSGLDLADYQQNFIANGTVKISLICLDPPASRIITGETDEPLRVASMDEVFATKCVVCAERSKTRDWFDLYVLMTQHGYGFQDFYRTFARLGFLNGYANAAMRLRKCVPDLDDPGYEQLLQTAPSLEELRTFFNANLDELEVDLATNAFLAKGR